MIGSARLYHIFDIKAHRTIAGTGAAADAEVRPRFKPQGRVAQPGANPAAEQHKRGHPADRVAEGAAAESQRQSHNQKDHGEINNIPGRSRNGNSAVRHINGIYLPKPSGGDESGCNRTQPRNPQPVFNRILPRRSGLGIDSGADFLQRTCRTQPPAKGASEEKAG